VLVGLPTGLLDLELVDGAEGVVLRVVPVEELHRASSAAIPAGQAFDGDALVQQLGGRLVGLHQLGGGKVLERRDDRAQAGLVEPRLTVVVEVDAVEGLLEVVHQEHVPEALPPGHRWVVEVAGRELPAHRRQLVDEGALHLAELGAGAHAVAPSIFARTRFKPLNLTTS
jgi:hypothetical protein